MKLRTKQSVGPLHIVRRLSLPGEYRKEQYNWTFDNGFTQVLPADYWDELKGEFADRQHHIKYSDILIEL